MNKAVITANPQVKILMPGSGLSSPTVNSLPPLPDFIPFATGTASATSNCPSGDPKAPCKTMDNVRAFNEREEQEEIARRASLLPPIEDSNAFLGRPIAKPPVLIEGLLKQKRIMVLGASSKIGKTWTLINLSISIASGQP
jgi:hypothetical protein